MQDKPFFQPPQPQTTRGEGDPRLFATLNCGLLRTASEARTRLRSSPAWHAAGTSVAAHNSSPHGTPSQGLARTFFFFFL